MRPLKKRKFNPGLVQHVREQLDEASYEIPLCDLQKGTVDLPASFFLELQEIRALYDARIQSTMRQLDFEVNSKRNFSKKVLNNYFPYRKFTYILPVRSENI